MHPFLRGRLRVLLYFTPWIGVGALLTYLLVLLDGRPVRDAAAFAGPMTVLYAFVCLSAWWVCRAHPLASTPAPRLWSTLVGTALQSSAVWIVAATLWAMGLDRLSGIGLQRSGLLRDLAAMFPIGVVLYAQSIAVHYVILAFENAREAERRVLESQVTAREAELRALRAQLNPHFLFNSLNSISALTGQHPEDARRMCQLLGDFLRLSLALGARTRVPLHEELALAERYLAIEQVRFGDRLAVEKHVEPSAERCLVPPLLIQPLIENAVKHGVADRVEGGTIRITVRRSGRALEITVENPRDPEAPPRRGQGLGLENVRQRLDALDPRATRVDVTREPERFRVALTLPAVEDGAEADAGAAAMSAAAPATPLGDPHAA